MFVEAIRAYLESLGIDTSTWTPKDILDHVDESLKAVLGDRDNLEYTLTELMRAIQENLSTVTTVLSRDHQGI